MMNGNGTHHLVARDSQTLQEDPRPPVPSTQFSSSSSSARRPPGQPPTRRDYYATSDPLPHPQRPPPRASHYYAEDDEDDASQASSEFWSPVHTGGGMNALGQGTTRSLLDTVLDSGGTAETIRTGDRQNTHHRRRRRRGGGGELLDEEPDAVFWSPSTDTDLPSVILDSSAIGARLSPILHHYPLTNVGPFPSHPTAALDSTVAPPPPLRDAPTLHSATTTTWSLRLPHFSAPVRRSKAAAAHAPTRSTEHTRLLSGDPLKNNALSSPRRNLALPWDRGTWAGRVQWYHEAATCVPRDLWRTAVFLVVVTAVLLLVMKRYGDRPESNNANDDDAFGSVNVISSSWQWPWFGPSTWTLYHFGGVVSASLSSSFSNLNDGDPNGNTDRRAWWRFLTSAFLVNGWTEWSMLVVAWTSLLVVISSSSSSSSTHQGAVHLSTKSASNHAIAAIPSHPSTPTHEIHNDKVSTVGHSGGRQWWWWWAHRWWITESTHLLGWEWTVVYASAVLVGQLWFVVGDPGYMWIPVASTDHDNEAESGEPELVVARIVTGCALWGTLGVLMNTGVRYPHGRPWAFVWTAVSLLVCLMERPHNSVWGVIGSVWWGYSLGYYQMAAAAHASTSSSFSSRHYLLDDTFDTSNKNEQRQRLLRRRLARGAQLSVLVAVPLVYAFFPQP